MASRRGDALTIERSRLIEATRRGAKATSTKDIIAAADDMIRAQGRIAALEKIGLASTRLHAV